MTAEHKRALAQGRAEGAVRSYLEALDQNRPPARSPAPASIEKRLKAVSRTGRRRPPADCSSSRSAWISSELDRIDAADDLTASARLREGGQGLRRAQGHLVRGVA